MKSWRRPWQATGDKSNGGHPRGASRFNRVIPSSATPSTGRRTPLHRHRFASPYGLRSAAASPLSTGPQQALKKLHGRLEALVVCKGYASTINSKPPGRIDRGPTPAPGAGRLVSQRQDELDLRGREGWPPALPSGRKAHPLHAPDARRVARQAATAVGGGAHGISLVAAAAA